LPFDEETKNRREPTAEDSKNVTIHFYDENENQIEATKEDLLYIVVNRSFPEKYTKLSLNGEYIIESSETPYTTTFTDKIEYDCHCIAQHSSDLLSASIAEVSWL
jgi:hypothetical protein